MKDQDKSKEELIDEVVELRGYIARLQEAVGKHRKTEEALRESEERYRNIIETIEDGYYEVDIEGNFTLTNIGESGSNLEWEITEYPEWGNWTLNPISGVGLTPEAGSVKINVTIIAPDNETEEFFGNLTVINKHDRDDYYNLHVYLETPRTKPLRFNLLSWFLERFPLMERLLNLVR